MIERFCLWVVPVQSGLVTSDYGVHEVEVTVLQHVLKTLATSAFIVFFFFFPHSALCCSRKRPFHSADQRSGEGVQLSSCSYIWSLETFSPRHRNKWCKDKLKKKNFPLYYNCIVLYFIDMVVIAALMHCHLFKIYPPNLGITRT
jgi:hypothetical protein